MKRSQVSTDVPTGSYISITPSDQSDSSVTYSSTDTSGCMGGSGIGYYNVQETRIYSPSVHTYNGTATDAEFIIFLNNITGGRNLQICIPIQVGSAINKSSEQLDYIINIMGQQNVSKEEAFSNKSNIPGWNNFNLNTFMPKKKAFYKYTATSPFDSCDPCTDFVVYNPVNSNLNISSKTLKILQSALWSDHSISVNTLTNDELININYSRNENGAVYGDGGDDIYIDCSPTGSSGETLIAKSKSNLLADYPFSLITNAGASIINQIRKFGTVFFVNIMLILSLLGIMYGIPYALSATKSSGKVTKKIISGGKKGALEALSKIKRGCPKK